MEYTEEPDYCADCDSMHRMPLIPVIVDGRSRKAWICDECGRAHLEAEPSTSPVTGSASTTRDAPDPRDTEIERLRDQLVNAATAQTGLLDEIERLRANGETLADFACTAPGRLPERITAAVVVFKGENARRTPQTS